MLTLTLTVLLIYGSRNSTRIKRVQKVGSKASPSVPNRLAHKVGSKQNKPVQKVGSKPNIAVQQARSYL